MVAGTIASGGRSGGSDHTPLIVSPTLTSHHYRNNASDEPFAVVPIQSAQCTNGRQGGDGIGRSGDPMFTGTTRGDHAVVAFHAKQDPISGHVAPVLGSSSGGSVGVLAFHATQDPISARGISPAISARGISPAISARGISPAISASAGIGVLSFDEQQITSGAPARQSRIDVIGDARPRRLTPREWERLQGFPDDYTLIEGADDSPRYEALGNSMAVPVMHWIGRRLQIVDGLKRRVV
jgi:DNA (cytosine-5)-methyltransferase 1